MTLIKTWLVVMLTLLTFFAIAGRFRLNAMIAVARGRRNLLAVIGFAILNLCIVAWWAVMFVVWR